MAVLDTGIMADHAAFLPGQVVAWYDFGLPGGPTQPDTRWDPRVEPYDDDGHGTAVASMVAGVHSGQTPSHAPGIDLAVAKVSGRDGGASWNDVARALQWATDVVEADVVSLSFYAYLPQTGLGHGLLTALEETRSKDVLPVVLAGNGMNNMGAPTYSWMHPPGSSPDSLVVGGARSDGTPVAPLGSMDPEVTALYSTTVACLGGPDCLRSSSGTSYSAPLVAGMAARLVQDALDAGQDPPGADRLEELLKHAARPASTPNLEGYGFLDAQRLQVAREHLAQGTLPERDARGEAAGLYVETVQQALRDAWQGRI